MEIQELLSSIEKIISSDRVMTNVPMSAHTTFRIGGNADIFVSPATEEEIVNIIKLLKEINVPYVIIGNGSNVLFSDSGFRGVVINIADKFSGFKELSKQEEGKHFLEVLSGTMLSKLGNEVATRGWSGFEFATGIPGTIGGAVRMNAGAYGGEMKDVIVSARILDKEGSIKELSVDELELGYRTSIISKEDMVVLSVILALGENDPELIIANIKDLATRRRDKQPLEYPSAGSTFKRPEGYFAGKLIEDSGLKGLCVGGACVSEKHAGFVVNKGNATAQDFCELTDKVKEEVKKNFGVDLELEVIKIGF